MSNHLGHTISQRYSGSDATDADDNPVEYKSTIQKSLTATYNGISVFNSWEEQEEYLHNVKIAKYKWHFFARYKDGEIEEIWKMSGEQVLQLLLPKLQKHYHSVNKRKDPRLGASLNSREISSNGIRVSSSPPPS